MSRSVVPGAARTPVPYGLFSVLSFREGSTDRWEQGVEFEGLGCPVPDGHTITGYVCDPEGGEAPDPVGIPKVFEGGLDLSEADPFTVYESYVCTPIGNPIEFGQEVARERLLAREEIYVERRLAAILAANASLTTLPDADSLKTAIATLEQSLATEYGLLGVLHMSRYIATLALEKGLVENRSGRLSTKLGTPVIAGSGYAFEGIYASPAMFGYRSEVFPSIQAEAGLDRANNNLQAIAERSYLIGFDDCGLFYIEYAESGDEPIDPETP